MSALSPGRTVLVVGGARSGKSRFALKLAAGTSGRRAFVATYRFDPGDHEMVARIAVHRRHRDVSWTTIEEPVDLGECVTSLSREYDVLVVDCLTVWLANLVGNGEPDGTIERRLSGLTESIRSVRARVVLVSNEVGMGIVPATPLGRAFRDWQGLVNQAMAEAADDVYAMTAGLALRLKPAGVS
jgi:adenosylcobinamide kinase/adenosylcobinamide-phosphate guanylyltransferase